MLLRQQGVGCDTSSREMEIKWEEILAFAVRWRECLCLTASKPQLTWWGRRQQMLEQVCELPLQFLGGAQMLKACYYQGEVTLVVWYLLVNGCF